MIWIWDALHRGLEPQPWHYNITQTLQYPNLPKIHPWPAEVQQCKGGHIYPSTAHQGAETPYIYIWYRCEMHSTVVWSLNHAITTSLRLGPTPISQEIHPWLWDPLHRVMMHSTVGSEPQLWHDNITRAIPYRTIFQKKKSPSTSKSVVRVNAPMFIHCIFSTFTGVSA
jgi:hypothetical protein